MKEYYDNYGDRISYHEELSWNLCLHTHSVCVCARAREHTHTQTHKHTHTHTHERQIIDERGLTDTVAQSVRDYPGP